MNFFTTSAVSCHKRTQPQSLHTHTDLVYQPESLQATPVPKSIPAAVRVLLQAGCQCHSCRPTDSDKPLNGRCHSTANNKFYHFCSLLSRTTRLKHQQKPCTWTWHWTAEILCWCAVQQLLSHPCTWTSTILRQHTTHRNWMNLATICTTIIIRASSRVNIQKSKYDYDYYIYFYHDNNDIMNDIEWW